MNQLTDRIKAAVTEDEYSPEDAYPEKVTFTQDERGEIVMETESTLAIFLSDTIRDEIKDIWDDVKMAMFLELEKEETTANANELARIFLETINKYSEGLMGEQFTKEDLGL